MPAIRELGDQKRRKERYLLVEPVYLTIASSPSWLDSFSPDQSYQACNSDPLTVNVVVNKLLTKETVLDLGDIEPGPFISQAKAVDIQPGDWVTPNAGNGVCLSRGVTCFLLPLFRASCPELLH